MAVELTTGEAARMLGLSPNTLRAWERRLDFPGPPRTKGQHRRYDRTMVLGLRDALAEGLTGTTMFQRAIELQASGRYSEPPPLRERMERIERELRGVNVLLAELITGLDNAGIIRRRGRKEADPGRRAA